MHARYTLLADSAIISVDGKITATGIFETINVIKLPAVHPQMTLVAQLEGTTDEIGEHDLLLELHDEKGKLVSSMQLPPFVFGAKDSPGPTIRAGIVARIANTRFDHIGEHEIRILVDGRFLASVAFTVVKVQIIKPSAEA